MKRIQFLKLVGSGLLLPALPLKASPTVPTTPKPKGAEVAYVVVYVMGVAIVVYIGWRVVSFVRRHFAQPPRPPGGSGDDSGAAASDGTIGFASNGSGTGMVQSSNLSLLCEGVTLQIQTVGPQNLVSEEDFRRNLASWGLVGGGSTRPDLSASTRGFSFTPEGADLANVVLETADELGTWHPILTGTYPRTHKLTVNTDATDTVRFFRFREV